MDPNIDFEDAKNDEISEFRIIPDNEKEKIWQPFYHTVYDNAVIGETIKEEFYTLGVIIESNPKERVASAPKESLIYPGAHNPLVATQKMKMKYRCDFFVRNFKLRLHSVNSIILGVGWGWLVITGDKQN